MGVGKRQSGEDRKERGQGTTNRVQREWAEYKESGQCTESGQWTKRVGSGQKEWAVYREEMADVGGKWQRTKGRGQRESHRPGITYFLSLHRSAERLSYTL